MEKFLIQMKISRKKHKNVQFMDHRKISVGKI